MVGAILVALVAMLFIGSLERRAAMGDVDAYAYITGAYSLREGRGYVDLMNQPLNHWPPGYSLLLALSDNPIETSHLLNVLCFGLGAGVIYLLAKEHGWPVVAALGLSAAVSSGFFRLLAIQAHPDILTFSFFLLGVLLFQRGNRSQQMLAYCIWNALIPFKFIAIAFSPAALLTEAIGNRRRLVGDRRVLSLALGGWVVGLGATIAFNLATIGEVASGTHKTFRIDAFGRDLVLLGVSIPRTLITSWYGSIRDPQIAGTMAILLALGVACIATLKPTKGNARILVLGTFVLVVTVGMRLIRDFDLSSRLTGYGLIILVLVGIPRSKSRWLWVSYGLASIAIAIVNAAVPHLGINDPRYEHLAETVVSQGIPVEPLMTNSFHILDVHERVATVRYAGESVPSDVTFFLWVSEPNHDAIAAPVTPIPRPSPGWCKVYSVEGATLLRRCPRSISHQPLRVRTETAKRSEARLRRGFLPNPPTSGPRRRAPIVIVARSPDRHLQTRLGSPLD